MQPGSPGCICCCRLVDLFMPDIIERMSINGRFAPLCFFLLVLLIFGAGCGADARDRRAASGSISTPAPAQATPVRTTYEVERGRVVYEIESPGRIVPVRESTLAFTVDGVVKELLVERGGDVEAGELLAKLDTMPLEEELLLAQTALDIAQIRLDTATAELVSQRRLAEIAVEQAQLDLDFARTQAGVEPAEADTYEIAKLELLLEAAEIELGRLGTDVDLVLQADVRAAELRVAELQEELTHMQLVAPFAGQITSLNLSPDRVVTAQEAVGVIGDVSDMDVSAGIQGNRLQELTENMPAILTPSGSPLDQYVGTITHLPQAGEEEVLRLSFDDRQAASNFSLGDRMRVTILAEEHEDVLWLPPSAVRDFNGRRFVVILDGDLQRRADITLGLEGDDRVEILSGVEEGDRVIAP